MPSLKDTVLATVARFEMLDPGAPLVVMVSGGADSTALLRLLAVDGVAAGQHPIVLHVNHMLRAGESDSDEAFVRALAERLGLTFVVERVDVAALALAGGLNLEDAGRRVRYEAADRVLDEACVAAGVPACRGRIAVAHTRDDRTESFLMRLAQGSGAGGLTTMRPVRDRVVRPLIESGRDEVRAYLADAGQEWREDESNADTTRLRARVRSELLPVLRDINPRFDETLARTIGLLADDDDLLAELADAFARDFTEPDGDVLRFSCEMLATLSTPMRRRAVRSALLTAFPEASRLEFDHVEALVSGLAEEGFARDLPGALRAETRYGTMTVFRAGEGGPSVAPALLSLPGIARLGEAGIIEARSVEVGEMPDGPRVAVVDADRIRGPLRVTGPQPGDRMRPLGMRGTKKLSDILVDAKVPRSDRRGLPVVRDGDRIVWVAGVRVSDEYRVDETTRRAMRLEWRNG